MSDKQTKALPDIDTLLLYTIWHSGHSIPNQQKKSGPLSIFVKFGTNMAPFKKLSHTKIWLIS